MGFAVNQSFRISGYMEREGIQSPNEESEKGLHKLNARALVANEIQQILKIRSIGFNSLLVKL